MPTETMPLQQQMKTTPTTKATILPPDRPALKPLAKEQEQRVPYFHLENSALATKATAETGRINSPIYFWQIRPVNTTPSSEDGVAQNPECNGDDIDIELVELRSR